MHVALNTWTNYVNVVAEDGDRLSRVRRSVRRPEAERGLWTRPRPLAGRGATHSKTSQEDRHEPSAAATVHAETAAQKARLAEDAWNSRDPARVALAYTEDSRWRNRAEFLQAARRSWLPDRKWARELDYRLIKESGHSRTTASPCALPMNGTTTAATGSAATATRTGNSTNTA